MKVLIDVTHPAHAHFFRHSIHQLLSAGHDVLVTTRDKECATDLVAQFGIEHQTLEAQRGRNAFGLIRELWARDRDLVRVVRSFRPDAMAAIGGTFVAHTGFLTSARSIVFYDTEIARLQNFITYPLVSLVVVPRCYRGWLPRNHLRYDGYHELAYLSPERFTPDRDVAVHSGLDPTRDNFLVRVVSWEANHDISLRGWSLFLLRAVIDFLRQHGNVVISSESELPHDLRPYQYAGAAKDLHHLLAYCRCYIGESATMASEAAVLGVPAVFAARTWRGYTKEQEERYGIVFNVPELSLDRIRSSVQEALSRDASDWTSVRQRILNESIDVTELVTRLILDETDISE